MVRSQRRKGFHPRDVVAGRRQRVLLQFLKQGNLEAEYQTTSKFVKIIKFHKSWIIMNHHESYQITLSRGSPRCLQKSLSGDDSMTNPRSDDAEAISHQFGSVNEIHTGLSCSFRLFHYCLMFLWLSIAYILHYIIIILHIWDIYWICIWNIIYIYNIW